jgi:hypothetical protein
VEVLPAASYQQRSVYRVIADLDSMADTLRYTLDNPYVQLAIDYPMYAEEAPR